MVDPGERHWVFYTSPAGVDLVAKEIRKACLDGEDEARLIFLLERIRAGRHVLPRDRTQVGDGVLEAHLETPGARRSYRLCYAVTEGGLVLLGLSFFEKRGRRQQRDLDMARKRYRNWRRR